MNAVVVATLALTIGSTTAAYGVIRHLIFAPLPYSDGNRIVSLEIRDRGDGTFRWDISAENYRLWSARSRTLENFAGYTWDRLTIATNADDPRAGDTLKAGTVTPSFFQLLRVRATLGRTFSTDDARNDAPVVILSQSTWIDRFVGDPRVVGKSISVNGQRRTIIGVLAAGIGPPVQNESSPAVWLPMKSTYQAGLSGFARLRPGVTSEMATRELDMLLRAFSDTSTLNGKRAEARTAIDRLEPQQRTSVELLFGAACGLLLIACADIAGLLLMRGWSRRREFAIRQTLGAGRGRLARQLLTESLLLGVPSGAAGILITWLGLRPAVLGYFAEVQIDTPLLIWTAAISLTTVIVFGAVPAILAWERSLDGALRGGGTGSGTANPAGRAHTSLVVAQIALTLVFLASAGVLGRSFVALVRTPIGYEPAGLLEISVQRAAPRERSSRRLANEQRAMAVRAVRAALIATPGVSEVDNGTIPMTHVQPGPTAIETATGVQTVDIPVVAGTQVGPAYFQVARIKLTRGRAFDASSATKKEVIINETLARHLWPERDAVGARLRIGEDEWVTVVGVTQDVRMPGNRAAEFFKLQMYDPDVGDPRTAGRFVLRSRLDPTILRQTLAQAVERAGVGATLKTMTTAESTLEYAYRGPRYAVTIFGAFATVAVVLAAVGLFGIVGFVVVRRTREIGIRVALGAEPSVLARSVLGQTARLLVAGSVIGVGGAVVASRSFSTLVYGVSPTDPFAFGGATGLLAIVALVASAIPVRRALRVDPTVALRAE